MPIRSLPKRNRRRCTTIVIVAMVTCAMGVCLAAVYAQSPSGGTAGWHSSSGNNGQPQRLPAEIADADLPQLPPRADEDAAPQVTPAQLMRGDPLLESMLYQHDSEKSAALPALRQENSTTNSRQTFEPSGLLGEMLQTRQSEAGGNRADASPRTAVRLPRGNLAAPKATVAPAHYQDEFDFGLPRADIPLPIPDSAGPPPTDDDVAPEGLGEPIDPDAEDLGAALADNARPEDATLGEAPEENDSYLQFLRQETILLEPGEHQLDITFQYLTDTTDFTFAQPDENDELQIVTLRRRQRLILLPVELRYGLTCTTQGFVNVPVGWASDEVIFGSQEDTSDSVGLGDVSFGITEVLMEGGGQSADVLATLAVTAPTGESSFATSLAVPGSNLGSGFWSVAVGLTFIHTYDPIVVFYGVGYQHRFDNNFAGGFEVNPGEVISYRLGVGFAVNPQITLSTSFNGSFITENQINGIVISGSDQEPLSLRFAATIAKDTCGGCGYSMKTVEPFANIGMTNEAIDALIGISWTY